MAENDENALNNGAEKLKKKKAPAKEGTMLNGKKNAKKLNLAALKKRFSGAKVFSSGRQVVAAMVLAAGLLLAPQAAKADIKYQYEIYPGQEYLNPKPSEADIANLNAALDILEFSPAFRSHPIHYYLGDNNPNRLVIMFDNKSLNDHGSEAFASGNVIRVYSGRDMAYYAEYIAHETIHAAFAERYGNLASASYLTPYDYSLITILEEALANTWQQYMRTMPELSHTRDRTIFMQDLYITNKNEAFDCIENNLRQNRPNQSDQWYQEVALRNFFEYFISTDITYLGDFIPEDLQKHYGSGNRFLIPEYQFMQQEPYRTELIKDVWEIVKMGMPVSLEQGKNTLSYFEQKFNQGIAYAKDNQFSNNSFASIDYWVNQTDYRTAASRRMSMNPNETFQYLPDAEMLKLYSVLREHGLNIPAAAVSYSNTASFER